jgi:hypothetical protein
MLGAALDFIGDLWSNRENKNINNANLAWQQMMAETAYQRTMRDMRKAGLNPILAASRGATGWGTPNPIAMQNPLADAADNLALQANTAANVRHKDAQIANLAADTTKKIQDALTSESSMYLNREQIKHIGEQIAKIRVEIDNIKASTTGIGIKNEVEEMLLQLYKSHDWMRILKAVGPEATAVALIEREIEKILSDDTGQTIRIPGRTGTGRNDTSKRRGLNR